MPNTPSSSNSNKSLDDILKELEERFGSDSSAPAKSSSSSPKKSRRKMSPNMIMGALVFVLLVVGVASAMLLSQTRQELRQQAYDGQPCTTNSDCGSGGTCTNGTCTGSGINECNEAGGICRPLSQACHTGESLGSPSENDSCGSPGSIVCCFPPPTPSPTPTLPPYCSVDPMSVPAGSRCDRSAPDTNDCGDGAIPEVTSCTRVSVCGSTPGVCRVVEGSSGANLECGCFAGSGGGTATATPIPTPTPLPDTCTGGANPECRTNISNCGEIGKVNGSGTCSNGGLCCVESGTGGNSPTPNPTDSGGNNTPTPNPTSNPTPTPVAGLCVSLTMAHLDGGTQPPVLGDTVIFTCGSVTGADSYEFRYRNPAGSFIPLAADASGSRVSVPFTYDNAGNYRFQCRPCFGNTCQEWEQ